MNFQLLIKEIEQAFGFQDMVADENNELTFSSDDVYVTIKEDNEHFIFLTRLCTLPESPLPLYKFALSQNDFAKLDAYIGINERDLSLTMTTKFPSTNLVSETLLNKLEKHFLHAESLLTKIHELEDDNKVENVQNSEFSSYAIKI